MLPETFTADTCFPNVSQFCHKPNSVSGSKICFCLEVETYFAAGNNVSRVAKLGNIKPWQKGETCCQKPLLWTHVSPMFLSFATRETLFPAAKCVSASRQKHFCLREQCFTCDKTGNHWGNMCPQRMFLATCFLVSQGFSRLLTQTVFKWVLSNAIQSVKHWVPWEHSRQF